jgi:hypothetical protein
MIERLKKVYSNQFSVEEGLDWITSYIEERKGEKIPSITFHPFEMQLYQAALQFVITYYENLFTITKVIDSKNRLVHIY